MKLDHFLSPGFGFLDLFNFSHYRVHETLGLFVRLWMERRGFYMLYAVSTTTFLKLRRYKLKSIVSNQRFGITKSCEDTPHHRDSNFCCSATRPDNLWRLRVRIDHHKEIIIVDWTGIINVDALPGLFSSWPGNRFLMGRALTFSHSCVHSNWLSFFSSASRGC